MYRVTILRRAQKELGALAGEAYTRIRDAIGGLAEDPRPPGTQNRGQMLASAIPIERCSVCEL